MRLGPVVIILLAITVFSTVLAASGSYSFKLVVDRTPPQLEVDYQGEKYILSNGQSVTVRLASGYGKVDYLAFDPKVKDSLPSPGIKTFKIDRQISDNRRLIDFEYKIINAGRTGSTQIKYYLLETPSERTTVDKTDDLDFNDYTEDFEIEDLAGNKATMSVNLEGYPCIYVDLGVIWKDPSWAHYWSKVWYRSYSSDVLGYYICSGGYHRDNLHIKVWNNKGVSGSVWGGKNYKNWNCIRYHDVFDHLNMSPKSIDHTLYAEADVDWLYTGPGIGGVGAKYIVSDPTMCGVKHVLYSKGSDNFEEKCYDQDWDKLDTCFTTGFTPVVSSDEICSKDNCGGCKTRDTCENVGCSWDDESETCS